MKLKHFNKNGCFTITSDISGTTTLTFSPIQEMKITDDFNNWDFEGNGRIYFKENYSDLIEKSNYDYSLHGLSRSSQKEESDWSGTKSFKQAYDYALGGWKEGIEKIKLTNQKSTLLKKTKPTFLLQPLHQISGSYVDIGRYLTGRPDCMIYNQVNTTPKRITIIVKLGFNSGASESDYFDYGSSLLSIIDYYEKQNIRIELISRFSIYNCGRSMIIEVKLKEFGEFLDINKLTFTLCNPSFQRRIIFSYQEKMDKAVVEHFGFHSGNGYGSTDQLWVTEEENKNCLCLTASSFNNFSNENELIDNLEKKAGI